LFIWLIWFIWLVFRSTKKPDKRDKPNKPNKRDAYQSRRGRDRAPRYGVSPSGIDLSTAANGNIGQAPSPYNPNVSIAKNAVQVY
jgi:hypothetical protein